jgi:hypothetical protein
MGLDTFFHKCSRQEWNDYQEQLKEYENLPEEERENTEHPGRNFDPGELGYFRKVNFLMPFFDYSGNCEYKEIPRNKLEVLKDICGRLSKIQPNEDGEYDEKDIQLAQKLLPTQSGFFFGSTDYDRSYFLDVDQVFGWVSGVLDYLQDDQVVLMYCWW